MNLLLYSGQSYARLQTNAYIARVRADGGIVQKPEYVYEWYKLNYELGRLAGTTTALQWRRKYNALGGVKLNNVLGVDYVQTWYDFGTTSDTRVNATQGTAANQPAWATDASLPSGVRALSFDGSNDVMSVADLGVFNNQVAGTVIVAVKDFIRTAGDTSHTALMISINGGITPRLAIYTRRASASLIRVEGRRLDADAPVASDTTSLDGLNYISGEAVWGGNLLQGRVNGNASPSTTFSSGGGSTSATNSDLFNIGATNSTANRLQGIITDVTVGRIAATTAQLAALRSLEKAFYPALP